jgi:hypothetical protein
MVKTGKISRRIPALSSLLFAGIFVVFSVTPPGSADAGSFRSPCRIRYRSDPSIEWVCWRLSKGETLETVFGDRWRDVAHFNRIDRRHVYPGISLKIPMRLDDIRDYTPMPRHYQPAESEDKLILVDLSEQFLGAYEHGQLVFSAPIAAGTRDNATPRGEFRITAYSLQHRSSLYQIDKSTEFYPMNYGLRFHIDRDGVSYWFHGRDLPGYPASHGCIGLYDEDMQNKTYNYPAKPELEDAMKLFDWAVPSHPNSGGLHDLENGPKVLIIGNAPGYGPPPHREEVFRPVPVDCSSD